MALSFCTLQNKYKSENNWNLMNSQPYGIAKQLFRTTYSPSMQTQRPSSLNNTIFSQSHVSHSPMIRFEPSNGSSIVRETPKTGASINQNNLQDMSNKFPRHDYYPESKKQDITTTIWQKIEEISKRVSKNSQEITSIKLSSKNDENKIKSLDEEWLRFTKGQDGLYQECLDQIKTVKHQLAQNDQKFRIMGSQSLEKPTTRSDQKLLYRVKSLLEDRVKQETTKIKLIIENQISKVNHEMKWEMQKQKTQSSPFRSKLKYPFKSIKIIYNQCLQTPVKKSCKGSSRMSTKESLESPRVLMKNEQVYYIDREGFLLDQESYYILDSDQKMIRLSSGMLQQLRQEGLLVEK